MKLFQVGKHITINTYIIYLYKLNGICPDAI